MPGVFLVVMGVNGRKMPVLCITLLFFIKDSETEVLSCSSH